MKTLSSTLAAAQRRASGRPYVKAEVSDHYGDLVRLRLTRLYVGAEADAPAAAVVAADGSLVRARASGGTLFVSRVASPGPNSDYSSWTSLGSVASASPVALVLVGTDLSLYYVAADGVTVLVRVSTSHGASWGSAFTVATAVGTVGFLAAAASPGGHELVFWSVGATVYSSRWNGSSREATLTWTHTVGAVTGLAATHQLDWCLIVTGKDTADRAHVWGAVFGDGVLQTLNTWSALRSIQEAADGSGVSFKAPALTRLGGWRLWFLEEYAGTVAYKRLQYSTLFAAQSVTSLAWREPVAFDYTGASGAAAAVGGTTAWLVASNGVWRAQPVTAGLDLSADVIEAGLELSETEGRARLVLDNHDGRYGAGELAAAISRGRRLQLGFGYYTPEPEVPTPASGYWIESVTYSTGARSVVTLEARDGWWMLDRWRARRQFAWAQGDQTLFQLLSFVLGRAGLSYTLQSVSTVLTDPAFKPAFTVHPGESGKTAVLRLLEKAPDVLRMRGGAAIGVHPQGADAVQYAYAVRGETGGASHVATEAVYRDLGPRLNRTRAFGEDVFDERFDFEEIEGVGEWIGQVHDLNLQTGARAGERARDELRKLTLRSRSEELVALVQGGQEVYDVVTVTDAQAGLVAAKRRVLGLEMAFKPGKYSIRLRLSNA
jgi:hypothetical protein